MLERIRIRAYEEADIPAVTALFEQRVVAAGTLQIPYTTLVERAERFNRNPLDRLIVAEIDGRIVGHAGLHMYAGRRKHVGSLGMGVDAEFHNQGVGTRLMEALMDLADNWYNLRRVELTVFADNQRAIHLYEKFGFTIEGTHPAFAFREGEYVTALTMARLRPEPRMQDAAGGTA